MKRDEHGIIIQEGDYESLSGGDSAFTTGIMAFAGSKHDKELMPLFIINGKLVRHPYQETWNKPELTSRDQVIAFFASRNFNPLVHEACLNYAKSWWVNKDILMPADKLYLYKCAGSRPPLWLYPLAYVNQYLALLWDCFIKPDHEMNQSICKNTIFGKWFIETLYLYHPDVFRNVRQYYSGWRNKEEIGGLLILKIKEAVYGKT